MNRIKKGYTLNQYSLAILLFCFSIIGNISVWSGPGNIATLAKISASAELNSSYSAHNVNDGINKDFGYRRMGFQR